VVSRYVLGRGHEAVLLQQIGGGRGGRIYSLADTPHLVAKILRQPTPDDEERVSAMVRNGQYRRWYDGDGVPLIAWPAGILRDAATKQFAGFVMPRLTQPPYWPLAALVGGPLKRPPEFEDVNLGFLMAVSRRIAEIVSRVHAVGYTVPDISEVNILVTPEGKVAIVDADNFRPADPADARRFSAPTFARNHMSPELIEGRQFATRESDCFGLAILICRILMLGEHPFGGYPKDHPNEERDEDDNIREGRCRLLEWDGIDSNPAVPPPTVLTPSVMTLVRRAFSNTGLSNPGSRPHADEWAAALATGVGELRSCAKHGSTHLYPVPLSACPWCARIPVAGDTFPAHVLTRAPSPAPAPAAKPKPAPAKRAASRRTPQPAQPTRPPAAPSLYEHLAADRWWLLGAAALGAVAAILALVALVVFMNVFYVRF
jgi:DNA-binding helix-hairpin-helix protein with protein kinase domain